VRILVHGGGDRAGAVAAATGASAQDAGETRYLASRSDAADPTAQTDTQRADQFVDEIRSSLDYYLSQFGGSGLSNVVLTGGGALLGGLADRLARTLRLPVEVGNVFDRWPVKDTVYGLDELAQVGPSLAVAVGLALGGLK
jgi:type IV pilus assembly protein PilM